MSVNTASPVLKTLPSSYATTTRIKRRAELMLLEQYGIDLPLRLGVLFEHRRNRGIRPGDT